MTHNLLAGKRGIVFGALNEDSIAWKVAVKAVEEGAKITLSNTPMALRMGELDELSKQLNAPVIPADATSVEDLEKVFSESVEKLGGQIDFVPILEDFIAEHPDFSYQGARAILAVTGHEGVFGYRCNTSYISSIVSSTLWRVAVPLFFLLAGLNILGILAMLDNPLMPIIVDGWGGVKG